MSTIASLVAKLGIDDAGFNFAVPAARMAEFAANTAMATVPMNRVSDAAEKARGTIGKATDAANGYLAALVGIGSAGALVSKGINVTFKADRAALTTAKANGSSVEANNMAEAYERVSRAVNSATSAFGEAFTRSSGLAKVMDQIASIIASLTPLMSTLGSVIGTVVGVFTMWGPLTAAIAITLKAIAVATILAAAAAIWYIKSWALNTVLVLLTGMTTRMALVAVWTGICTVAQWAFNAALAAAAVIGLPIWLAVAAVAAVVAAILGVIVGIVMALGKAWDWLTSGKVQKGLGVTAEQLEELARKAKEAREAADEMDKSLAESIRTFGMTEAQKDLDKYVAKLQEARFSSEYIEAAEKIHQARQNELAALERSYAVAGKLLGVMTQLRQLNMTEAQKKYDELRIEGYSPAQAAAIKFSMQASDFLESAAKKRKKLEEEVAEIRKKADAARLAAAQVDMTEKEKQLADLKRRGGATLANRLNPDLDAIEAGEKRKKLAKEAAELAKMAADLQREADTAGLTAAQAKLKILKDSGLKGDALAKATFDANRADAAEQQKKDTEAAARLKEQTATPLEKYKRALSDIARLQSVGALKDPAVAANALAFAKKEFLDGIHKDGSFKLESPTALLRGSAEAELAANRQKSPIDKLTEVQREQLAAQKRLEVLAQGQIDATKENKPEPDQVASLN